ncbi:DUF1801 domain-containing protein [Microbacterium sp. NPDC055910]|uniref:DUF1801 domain-containing protein n=1 Tax=Microbacterium sp. NPDC055910 TaxID=3345659 RepID=UPI0035DDBD09
MSENTGSAKKSPAMSPSDVPVEVALEKATGARRDEADELLELFGEITGEPPVVWAGRIVGFGTYEYRYESGHSGQAPLLAFASGAAHHTIYFLTDFTTRWPDLLDRLGKHRASKACLYVTRLSGVDRDVLRELLELSLAATGVSEAQGSHPPAPRVEAAGSQPPARDGAAASR